MYKYKTNIYIEYLKQFIKYLKQNIDSNMLINLDDPIFENMYRHVLDNQFDITFTKSDLRKMFEDAAFRHSLHDLDLFIDINKMIDYETTDKATNNNDIKINYAIVEKLSQLAQSMVEYQKQNPKHRLIYQNQKLYNIDVTEKMPTKLSQIPNAIGPMRYQDMINNLKTEIESITKLLDQFQPFLYVANHQPDEVFNVNQFSNYMPIWNQLYQLTYSYIPDWVATDTKFDEVTDFIKHQHQEPGELEINQSILDQLTDQRDEYGFKLLYNRETIDEDIMKNGEIRPMTNQDVYEIVMGSISRLGNA